MAAGERYDADAGLQYLNARYYDPELARFIQPDWFEVTKAGSNRYSYSFNDPINASDPSGNIPDNWGVSGYETAYDSGGYTHAYNSGLDRSVTTGYESWSDQRSSDYLGLYNSIGEADRPTYGFNAGTSIQFDINLNVTSRNNYATSGKSDPPIVEAPYILPWLAGGGALIKGIGWIGKTAVIGRNSSRVFWSGASATNIPAKVAAEAYANANASITLEMTFSGKILDKISRVMPYAWTKPAWNIASRSFARGAKGTTTVFKGSKFNPKGVWSTIERPVLESRGVSIIERAVK